MVAVHSTMLPLGTPCPDFQLPDGGGKPYKRDDFAHAPALVVAFISNHCPYVKHLREGLAEFGREIDQLGAAMVAIGSNNVDRYPDDAPDKMVEEVKNWGYTFPYLYDETQDVAKAFKAACTPDFYVFDGTGRLTYRGQFDDSRPGNGLPVTGGDLRNAVHATIAGRVLPPEQVPSIGCNIKWIPGNEPPYFG